MPDHRMKFFTPALYMRYNSEDEDVADQAEAEWEQALENYRNHLSALPMTENVKVLSQQCFHDALLLDKTTHPARFYHFTQTKPPSAENGSSWISPHITSILLQNADELVQLLYSGAGVEPLNVDHSPEWNLWEKTRRWLYDEIDVSENESGQFIHRILWSDGSVLTIYFVDVSLVSVPLHPPGIAKDSDAASAILQS